MELMKLVANFVLQTNVHCVEMSVCPQTLLGI